MKIDNISVYNNNVLVIDDDIESNSALKDEIVEPLKKMGFIVKTQTDPCDGRVLASHKYSVILIDYRFTRYDESQINGNTLCRDIRKKCPLSTLILITAYGSSEFEKISHGLQSDGTFAKGKLGRLPSKLYDDLKSCLTRAVSNRDERLPYLKEIHHDNSLNKFKYKLELLEEIFVKESNQQTPTPPPENWTVDVIAEEMDKMYKKDEESQKDTKKYITRESLTQDFQLKNTKTGELMRPALIFRHLLIENPNAWKQSRNKFKKLKDLIEYFEIE
jgi:hypothetical protein